MRTRLEPLCRPYRLLEEPDQASLLGAKRHAAGWDDTCWGVRAFGGLSVWLRVITVAFWLLVRLSIESIVHLPSLFVYVVV